MTRCAGLLDSQVHSPVRVKLGAPACLFDQGSCTGLALDAPQPQALLDDRGNRAPLSRRCFFQRTVQIVIECDGHPLSSSDRAAMDAMARYRTRAPKGVFIYHSAEEMERDRLRWRVDAIEERHRQWIIPVRPPGKM